MLYVPYNICNIKFPTINKADVVAFVIGNVVVN
jgi:hypothetical protein